MVERRQPAIRIDPFWKGRQSQQGGESGTRRDIATGATLMGTFPVVMLEKRFCDLSHLLQSSGLIPLQALLSIGSMIPFDKRVLVRPMRGTNIRFNPQAEQEPA